MTNPAHDIPLAMQIALRIEKASPPSDLLACEVAAEACVGLLVEAERRAAGRAVESHTEGISEGFIDHSDDEAAHAEPDPSWLHAVDAWRGVAIRKIVRRCSGKRWTDAQALDGVTIERDGASARAFVPGPASPLPPELKKMQVEGTELPARPETECGNDAGAPGGIVVTVRLSPLVTMTSGKSAAQCAHAAQRAWEAMTPDERASWARVGHRVRVVRDSEENWASQPGRVSIVDAGFTELEGQHETTRADW